MIDFNEGHTLCIDKPLTWSSFHVVKKIRFLTKAKKVGHAGTLDPLATGLLIICTGKHTKIINTFQGQEKEYIGKFKLGVTTASYDSEEPEENEKPISTVTLEAIEQCVKAKFTGTIFQKPPIFSAVKVGGERAYAKARKGEEVVIKPKEVTIHSFEILKYDAPFIEFKIVCGKGTYIRSIARDLGEALGCGAYMSELRRTRIGEFKIEDAYTVEQFEEMIKAIK
ncbi:MAG: tRNA pseudouridine55 synthase [Bacteroidia bacterium]|jgi:tRNA pseudouridine55 synthase